MLWASSIPEPLDEPHRFLKDQPNMGVRGQASSYGLGSHTDLCANASSTADELRAFGKILTPLP